MTILGSYAVEVKRVRNATTVDGKRLLPEFLLVRSSNPLPKLSPKTKLSVARDDQPQAYAYSEN